MIAKTLPFLLTEKDTNERPSMLSRMIIIDVCTYDSIEEYIKFKISREIYIYIYTSQEDFQGFCIFVCYTLREEAEFPSC